MFNVHYPNKFKRLYNNTMICIVKTNMITQIDV